MKTFLQVTHGFHVRNLLDTRLLELIKDDFDVVILANPGDASFLAADYADERVSVESVAIRERPVERLLEFVRKRIMIKPNRALTVSVFSARERQSRRFRHATLAFLNATLGRFRFMRRSWLALERVLVPGHEFDAVFSRHLPDLVITANYGTDPEAVRLLRAAKRHGVPSLTVVPSFDNLTSKGAIAAVPARMVVWNETMRREATEFHDIPPSAVAACGPVQFDIYADPARWANADAVWRAHGLDPTRPTLVVGTITPVYFKYNINVIELIADAIADGRLPCESQILVRLHPQVIHDPVFGDDLRAYREIERRYPFVRLNVPQVRRWSKLTPPARDDMAVLATILAKASAVIVPASTLAIDAAAVGTPVVGVGFDGKTQQPEELSVARYYEFTHYQPVTRSGAVKIAWSPTELIDAINAAIRDRAALADGRERLLNDLVGRHDGRAAFRIIEEMHALTARQDFLGTPDSEAG